MRKVGTSIAVIALASASIVAFAHSGFKNISEELTGYEETPSAVSSHREGNIHGPYQR
jgi:hypothetical protein